MAVKIGTHAPDNKIENWNLMCLLFADRKMHTTIQVIDARTVGFHLKENYTENTIANAIVTAVDRVCEITKKNRFYG